ncbi:hypothetical protein CIHG_08851 [Coccidioides immitis H538.4]|uniref:Uncharacterized protein n=3 Tax=Coccidioides immitis TaxID=5501 RepID=A0A0J8R1R3_COCIT|nr:hypothetical protein CIRG_04746 [Coccidioides immitis RMSCC 2394]KMU77593.1 hypothetical protein CISG_01350 [Coccidioides immitis RMSCC 3703]KMU90996.1 hypothetical protein CIHG_08851 [Coccidioides immitis H538.4]
MPAACASACWTFAADLHSFTQRNRALAGVVGGRAINSSASLHHRLGQAKRITGAGMAESALGWNSLHLQTRWENIVVVVVLTITVPSPAALFRLLAPSSLSLSPLPSPHSPTLLFFSHLSLRLPPRFRTLRSSVVLTPCRV